MKYHIVLRIIHWAMALCILGLAGLGLYMMGLTPEEGRYDMYAIHKSFGMLMIALLVARVIVRKTTKIPEMPRGIKPVEKKLSHIVHGFLYALMIVVPVVGYVMSSAGGYGVPFFGLKVPDILGQSKELSKMAQQAHWVSAYALLALVGLHVAGALKHRFFEAKENDVLNRMI